MHFSRTTEVHLVCFARLQTSNFRLFLQQTDKQQTVNGLRKIAWLLFPVFHLKRQHMWIYILKQQHIYTSKHKLMENGNFYLFAAKGKQKWQTSVFLLQTETEVCFPSTNDIQESTIAVSANVPIYAHTYVYTQYLICSVPGTRLDH
jgi:hypothetical protein